MTDQTQILHDPGRPATTSNPQLRYPELLIDAPFESLLTHSQTAEPQTRARMPVSEPSLSESWSSLSEHDFLQDDDLHSEATDTGSLVDASNTNDVHSLIDQDDSSHDEDEDIDDQDDDNIDSEDEKSRLSEDIENREAEDHSSGLRYNYYTAPPQESIRLDDSTVIVGASGRTSLQASKTFNNTEMQSSTNKKLSDDFSDESVGMIMMPLTTDNLKPGQQPYHIMYYGSPLLSSEIKTEVLGKIGAALISFEDRQMEDSSSEPPCYHIVPSDFGPGSRPSTADLIPIPSQMHISDCTAPNGVPGSSADIKLQLGSVRTVFSRRARLFESQDEQVWSQPDLAVIVVSQSESVTSCREPQRIADFAKRHQIPVICLRQEPGWQGNSFLMDTNPYMLHRSVRFGFRSHEGEREKSMMLDVDTFLALDSEQLNQHLRFLADMTKDSIKNHDSVGSYLRVQSRRVLYRISTFLPDPFAKKITHADDRATIYGDWIVDTAPSSSQLWAHSSYHTMDNITFSGLLRGEFLPLLHRTVVGLILFSSILFAMSLYQTALPYLMSMGTSKVLTIPAGHMDVVCSSVSTSSWSTTTTTITTTTIPTHAYALAGPLQVLEQQVQGWIPGKSAGGKKKFESPSDNLLIKHDDDINSRICHDIVPAHISPNLKVNNTFFKAGEPSFSVLVLRDGKEVPAEIEKHMNGVAFIMIKRQEYYGRLKVHLQSEEEQTCASIDLQDLVHEAVTLWYKSSDRKESNTVKRMANRYSRLLEIRTAKSGLVHSAIELSYSTTRKIGAAIEAVEKSAVKQAKICHQNKDECIVHQLRKDIVKTAQQAHQNSEDYLQTTQRQITETALQVKGRANAVAEQAREEVSRAVQLVQTSFGGISAWQGRMKETLGEAQRRAQKLVKYPDPEIHECF